MGKWKRPTMADIVKDPWFKSRPKSVKEKVFRYPPGLYRLRDTNQIALLRSYTENKNGACEECTVNILREHNPNITFERTVFGVPFTELEPIDTI